VEFVTTGDQKYEEEILVPEEIPKPSLTDFADTTCLRQAPVVVTLLRFVGNMGNLSLLTMSDYYHHKTQRGNGGKGNGDRTGIWYSYWWV
jgi:hypothetical protein